MFFVQESEKQIDINYIMDKIKVQTPFGLKKKKSIHMFKSDEYQLLKKHYDRTELLMSQIKQHPVTFKKIRTLMNHFKPLTLTLERICAEEALSITELFEVKQFSRLLHQLSEIIKTNNLEHEDFSIYPILSIQKLLDPEQLDMGTFYLYDGYSETLRQIRSEIKALEHENILYKKEKRHEISEKLKIKIRPNDEVMVEKHQESLIALLEGHDDFLYISDTLMHKTFKIKQTKEQLLIHERLDILKAEETEEELQIRLMLTKELNSVIEDIWCNIEGIAYYDLMIAKAYFALAFDMTKPVISEKLVCFIEEGVHLKVKEHLDREKLNYMPITVNLSSGMTCITGSNMGGKTICLKLIAQMQVMAQLGLFVPCKKIVFKPVDYIFLSSTDAQSIDQGLSTFGAEMVHIAEVLPMAEGEGLILIDELARGTNPKEGFAISKAIINYLKNKQALSVITTHLDGLADEKDVLHLQVKGLSEVNFEDLKINLNKGSLDNIHKWMDYRLKVIDTPEAVPKDAIKISKLMGLPDEILKDAKNILEHKEEK